MPVRCGNIYVWGCFLKVSSLEIGGASLCNSLVMILEVITDENKLTALLLNNLWLSECAVIALLKNERAPVILHWRCQNWKYHYTFPVFQHSFSFSFLTIIYLQYTSLLDEYGIHSPEMLYNSWWQQRPTYYSEILNLYLIQFWGRRWFLLGLRQLLFEGVKSNAGSAL